MHGQPTIKNRNKLNGISLFRALVLQWDVSADAGVLCDKAVLLFVVIKNDLCCTYKQGPAVCFRI